MAKRISLVILIVAAFIHTTVAQTYVVGDEMGWLVPPGGPIAYTTWAAMQNFTVGDILVFNFTTGEQDVARVTKEAYVTCNSTNPISLETTGPATFKLDSEGEYYFIGTMERRCPLGQKLAIIVTSASSGPTASPTPPPPTTPSPVSPRAPVTYIVGDELGWIVPPGGEIAYATWAYNKIFMVGDTLVFDFYPGEQDVARVTKEAYDTCNSTNTISLKRTGPAKFTLDTVGEYYFIGTMERRCLLGQKLAINVTAGPPSAAPSPPPPPPPATPSPVSPRAPVTYVVGDDLGWLVPPGGPIAYSTWAHKKSFIVGDTLVFNFPNGTQDVAEITKAAYDSCDTNSTLIVLATSPARITLTTQGEHYFICTYPRHCPLGQKLAINVTSSNTATPPSSTTAPPPSTTNTPSPSSITTPSPSTTNTPSPSSTTTPLAPSPTLSGGPALPPALSSAPTSLVMGFSIPFLSIVMALFY